MKELILQFICVFILHKLIFAQTPYKTDPVTIDQKVVGNFCQMQQILPHVITTILQCAWKLLLHSSALNTFPAYILLEERLFLKDMITSKIFSKTSPWLISSKQSILNIRSEIKKFIIRYSQIKKQINYKPQLSL